MYIFLQSDGVTRKVMRCAWNQQTLCGDFTYLVKHAFPGVNALHFTYPPSGDYHITTECENGDKFWLYSNRVMRLPSGETKKVEFPIAELDEAHQTLKHPINPGPSFEEFKNNPKAAKDIMTMGLSVLKGPSDSFGKRQKPRHVVEAQPGVITTFSIWLLGAERNLSSEKLNYLWEYRDNGRIPNLYMAVYQAPTKE